MIRRLFSKSRLPIAARDEAGRYVSANRELVKAKARAMREAFGLPESEVLR